MIATTQDEVAVESPKKGGDRPGERIPVLTKRKARNLYLFEDATHERIASECGLTVYASQKLVQRCGWHRERKQREAALVQKQDARMSGIDDEIIDAIASASEQHAIRALQKVGTVLERDDEFAAKDFQAYTSGVKNLASVARDMRTPAGQIQSPTSVNNFFFSPMGIKPEPEQVTEVQAKSVQ